MITFSDPNRCEFSPLGDKILVLFVLFVLEFYSNTKKYFFVLEFYSNTKKYFFVFSLDKLPSVIIEPKIYNCFLVNLNYDHQRVIFSMIQLYTRLYLD